MFDAGSRATVAITFLVKNPTATAGHAIVRYHDIGDYLSRQQKLALVDEATVTALPWETVAANESGDWINQRGGDFTAYPPLGDRKSGDGLFKSFGRGLETGRDAWVYSFGRSAVQHNVRRMIDFYNTELNRYQGASTQHGTEPGDAAATLEDFIDRDFSKIKWTSSLIDELRNSAHITFDPSRVGSSSYRPFTRENAYLDPAVLHRPALVERAFPTSDHPNYGIYQVGAGSAVPFSVLALDALPDLHVTGAGSGGQFFSRYTYEAVGNSTHESGLDYGDDLVDGYRRIDNITEHTLAQYRTWYDPEATKDEIFAFVYGLLHSPDYRQRFAHDLTRSLPRIPRINPEDWLAFKDAGQALLDLHIGYETVEPYPLSVVGDQPMGAGSADLYEWFAVEKMRWGGNARAADKSKIIYNPRITVAGLPDEAHRYMLGSRSAIEWIIDRYRITTDKASGIINNPNDYSRDISDPRYILDLLARVVTVSVSTVRTVESLPALRIVPPT